MAGINSAPGVYRFEKDISNVLVAGGISNGGIVVRAQKGPVRRPVLVTDNKEYINYFGEPYYNVGLDETNPEFVRQGGALVPELGYGSYGALEFLKESNRLYVVRGYGEDDRYSAVEVQKDATECTSCVTSGGIPVTNSVLDVFDTRTKISTYDEYKREGTMTKPLLVGYVGPGVDGNDYAVTVETIHPEAEWLYSYDEYPIETSATKPANGFEVAPIWMDATVSAFSTSIPTSAYNAVGEDVIVNLNNPDAVVDGTDWDIMNATLTDSIPDIDYYEVNVTNITETTADWVVEGLYTDTLSANPVTGTSELGLAGYTGSAAEVATYFPIASNVVKITIFKKSSDVDSWDDLYSNTEDQAEHKLRVEPLEQYYGTMTPQLDGDGKEMHIERSVNGFSKNIYVKTNGTMDNDATWSFGSGYIAEGSSVPTGTDDSGFYVVNDTKLSKLAGGNAEITTGFGEDGQFWEAYFTNKEELPVQILLNASPNDNDKLSVANVCSSRRDCIAVNQVGTVNLLNSTDIINTEKYGYTAPSYVALYAGYSEVYDIYNDKSVYLPNNLFAGAVYARVDRITEPWFAPAGKSRATLAVLDQNKIFNRNDIGKMYDKNINSIKYDNGFFINGQKTAQLKKSSLDRVNVRRNLLYIQQNIETTLNDFLFENNTLSTRLRVFSLIDDFLKGILVAEGLYDYDVVVDETNNTPSVIDANQLNVDIYVQPTQSIEYIKFTTVITRTGVSFGDVTLKYA